METAAEFVEGFRRYWSAPSLDPLPLLAAAASRPSGWRQLWRSGAATALLCPKGRPDAHRVQL